MDDINFKNLQNFMYTQEIYFQEYQFIKTPSILITSKFYEDLSLGAKMLYSILADRQSLSLRNKDKYTDENGKIFLIYTVNALEEVLHLSKKTIIKYKKELIDFELLYERRMGLGFANRLYILRPKYQEKAKNTRSVKSTLPEVKKVHFKRCKKFTSRSVKNTLPEVENLHPNHTNNNHTDYNHTNINQSIIDEDELIEDYKKYKNIILKNLNYDLLKISLDNSYLKEIDEIVELMLDVIISNDDVFVNKQKLPKSLIVKRFLSLEFKHIEYVLKSIANYSKKAKNIRSYLITCLYNSYSTVDIEIYNEISGNSIKL